MRLIFFLLALTGCASVEPDWDRDVAVRWVRLHDPDPVCRKMSGRVIFWSIKGCAVWSGSVCVIYARDVRGDHNDRDRLATLGHEVKHCFDGDWHDDYGNLKP